MCWLLKKVIGITTNRRCVPWHGNSSQCPCPHTKNVKQNVTKEEYEEDKIPEKIRVR
jgi:hypothetical protein